MPVFEIPTRWGDMDAQGHVNNAQFVEYLQEARTELLLAGPNAHLLGGGVVVTAHQVEFVRPVVHGQGVRVRVWVDQLGAARFSLAYELTADDEVALRARTTLCPFDLDTGRVRRLTAPEREHFASLQGETEPLRELPKAVLGAGGAHVYPVRARWGDLDAYGHVNNVRAYDYVQEARVAAMAAAGSGLDPDADRLWLVVRQDVDYLAQMRFRREPYAARTAVVALGSSSMTLACEVGDPETGEVFQRARTVAVSAGLDGRPRPLPDELRERLAPWQL